MDFIAMMVVSAVVIAITTLATYEILRWVWGVLPRMTVAPRLRVLFIMIPIFVAHILGIWIYAAAYFLSINMADIGVLTGWDAAHPFSWAMFVECLYFSATTYTSLGFGDVVPSGDLRMLASAEVLNGLVMIGWTISFTYLTMEKFWTDRR